MPVFYLTALIFGLSYWAAPIHDPDLGWHLLGGQWIDQRQTLPPYDFINFLNTEWLDYHWLAQVWMHQVFSWQGFSGIALLFAVLMTVLLLCIGGIIEKAQGKHPSLLMSVLLLVLALYLLSLIFSPRPQIIALVLIAFALRRLMEKPGSSDLPYIFSLQIVLANVHVYWVFLPFLWFAYRTLPNLLDRKERDITHALGAMAVLAAAGAVSPYGLKNYAVVLDYAALPAVVKEYVMEFKSAWITTFEMKATLAVGFIIVAYDLLKRASPGRIGDYIVFFFAFCLTSLSIKFAGVSAVLMMPALARSARGLFARFAPNIMARDFAAGNLALAPLLLIGLLSVGTGVHERTEENRLATLLERYPIAACAYIPHAGVLQVPVRIVTHFNEGGWCRWGIEATAPSLDARVSSDGRTQFVDEKHIREGFELYAGWAGWRDTLIKWRPDFVVVSNEYKLSELLLEQEGWRLLFDDGKFKVFAKETSLPQSAA